MLRSKPNCAGAPASERGSGAAANRRTGLLVKPGQCARVAAVSGTTSPQLPSFTSKVLKEPLFHFALIGAVIYGLYAFAGESAQSTDEDSRSITISAAEVQWLADGWQSRWNRPPTAIEFDNLLEAYIEERVLAQEARAMGLDQDDSVIRRRLAQRLKFLSEDLLMPADPDPAVLRQWFSDHIDDYREPVRYSISQVYFDPDRRQERALADAQALCDRLNRPDAVTQDLREYGDPFMLQNHFDHQTRTDLARAFGTDFAQAIMQLEPGRWHAPVVSGYGVHAVLVSAVDSPQDPQFSDVEQRVREDWTATRQRELTAEFIDNLIAQYDVEVESAQVPLLQTDAQPAAAADRGNDS